jgi:D-glycero-beta-D-manno-heptose 1-phosphate adenylyltransferase
MKQIKAIDEKIIPFDHIENWVNSKRVLSKKIAFTNGCFDILHEGHIYSLSQAAKEADFLIVGVNADNSVKKLKGEGRPVNNQDARAKLLASLVLVDAVVIFEQDTPLELIKKVMPDALIKGGDYNFATVVGAKEVIANGGQVIINPLIENISSTAILEKIKSL